MSPLAKGLSRRGFLRAAGGALAVSLGPTLEAPVPSLFTVQIWAFCEAAG